ncbi:MAG: NAD(P)H-hydrate dehydratase, partial [Clostridia bacterium]|nr:NAD(P)H-hydrate dehydratase [Clostridia bacterium]
MLVYTCEQMKVIEANADIGGLSSVTMMENAGNGCAEKIHSVLSSNISASKSVVILCGSGKNGGDGYVIAGNLCDKGYTVRIIMTDGLPTAYESKLMFAKLENKPVIASELSKNYQACVSACLNAGAIIDCVFGIGFHGSLSNGLSVFFNDISKSRAKKFAIDIPSGLEGDSGEIKSEHFTADYTLAITCFKPVHILKPAADCCGIVSLVDIGIDENTYKSVGNELIVSADDAEIARFFAPRDPVSNKGDYGKLLSVAGSRNMQGAAVMAAEAAVNSGVGIVMSVFPESAYTAIASKLTEPLTLPLDETEDGCLAYSNLDKILKLAEKSTAMLIGCGLGMNEETVKLVTELVRQSKIPLIIDADGINAISMNKDVLKETSAQIVLTPHPGEMARLMGTTVREIQSNRIAVANSFANEYNCIVVLKGS